MLDDDLAGAWHGRDNFTLALYGLLSRSLRLALSARTFCSPALAVAACCDGMSARVYASVSEGAWRGAGAASP